MGDFQAEEVKNKCVAWIQKFFEENGPECNAIVGISGGKDSSVVAALCVEALGRERVIGVLMPCGVQDDIDMAKKLVEHLGIQSYEVNIEAAVQGVLNSMTGIAVTDQTKTNLPPRIRMATLYAVSQSMNGRVANTCNLSEDWVGYSTRYGDAAGEVNKAGSRNFGFGYIFIGRQMRDYCICNLSWRAVHGFCQHHCDVAGKVSMLFVLWDLKFYHS